MISNLIINHFRNIITANINTAPRVNIFYGQNGAGKTSLLECIYYLGLGRSFRTNHSSHIISRDAERFSVFAHLNKNNQKIPMGIERARTGECNIKINAENIGAVSELAKYLPLQLMSTISYRFFFNGPKIRRQFLDWMLFHVEQSFFSYWQSFQRILKQRNASIKAKLPLDQITLWDSEFISTANEIDCLRRDTLTEFEPIFMELLQQLLPKYDIQISYQRGWKRDVDLRTLLQQGLQRDLQMGFTQTGPQRADLRLLIEGIPAQDVLSQGQQKLSLYAFHLAQGLLLKKKTQQGPIFLIDDITSELDHGKRDCIAQVLQEIDSQIFITAVHLDDLGKISKLQDASMFHVEHGTIIQK